jgi:hypothetical protein
MAFNELKNINEKLEILQKTIENELVIKKPIIKSNTLNRIKNIFARLINKNRFRNNFPKTKGNDLEINSNDETLTYIERAKKS